VERQTLSPRIHSRSATGVVACVVAGLGIAMGSSWMCADALASGEVVEILTHYALDPVTAYVVFPAGRRPSQRARAFSDYLEQALAGIGKGKRPSHGLEQRAAPPSRSARLHPLRKA
jgi:DNA-binding transcriptional LysR family regulator